MATIHAVGRTSEFPNIVSLSVAQVGNGASTNVADRDGRLGPAVVVLTTAIGATPTCTYTIEGSADGTNWFPVQYADSATPLTVVSTTFVITTAITTQKIIQPNIPAQFIRLTYSANTNVTNTADIYIF